jgi:DNA-binding HxlR family transcriptional regulator
MAKKSANHFNCATEFTLDVLGGKWKTVILSYLKQRPCRYSELRRLLPKLSDKILTERLLELTDRGLIVKSRARTTASVVIYSLTETGESLRNVLGHLYKWGLDHAPSFGVKLEEPLKVLRARR